MAAPEDTAAREGLGLCDTWTRAEFESRYQVGKILGKGGMGEVREALQVQLRRSVAIKFMRGELFSQQEAVRRFLRECQLLASLSHPGILQVYDFGVLDTRPFLVMELLPGGSLVDVLDRETRLAPARGLEVMTAVARALAHLHEQKIIHRDIKPRNIMFDSEGSPKLTDFGLSRDLDQKTLLTAEGAVMGSPLYVAPEFLMGEKASYPADIYSFGCTLYAAFSGKLPYAVTDGDLKALMTRKLTQEPAPIREYVPDLPEAIVEVIDRCLARRPADRYPTARELTAALRIASRGLDPLRRRSEGGARAGRPASGVSAPVSRQISATQRLGLLARAPRKTVLATIAAGSALLGLAVWWRAPAVPVTLVSASSEPSFTQARLRYTTSAPCRTALAIDRGGTFTELRPAEEPAREHEIELRDLLPGETIRWRAILPEGQGPESTFSTLELRLSELKVHRGLDSARVSLPAGTPARLLLAPAPGSRVGPRAESAVESPEPEALLQGLDGSARYLYEVRLATAGGETVEAGNVEIPAARDWLNSLMASSRRFDVDDVIADIQKGLYLSDRGPAWVKAQLDSAVEKLAGIQELERFEGLVGELVRLYPANREQVTFYFSRLMEISRIDHAARALGVPVSTGVWGLLGHRFWIGTQSRLPGVPERLHRFSGKGRLIVAPVVNRVLSFINEGDDSGSPSAKLEFGSLRDSRPTQAELRMKFEGMGRGTVLQIHFGGSDEPALCVWDVRSSGRSQPLTEIYLGFDPVLLPGWSANFKVKNSALPGFFEEAGIRVQEAGLKVTGGRR